MNTKIQLVKTEEDYNRVLAIRRTVFIEEQNVPESLEIENEDESFHVLALYGDMPVGTGRWRKTSEGYKLERFAVLKEFRTKGIGRDIVKFVLDQIPSEDMIYLHAQESVIKFYKDLGFTIIGSTFIEADIVHAKMVYKKENTNQSR
ncbi:MAG TPA: GNAT family N-acetyltransferase [Candidatus Marinimicrobia bacterium]|nr:GNAT family N-acetyltransferase [Candidatus Neomarinimicrobiota bacterium]